MRRALVAAAAASSGPTPARRSRPPRAGRARGRVGPGLRLGARLALLPAAGLLVAAAPRSPAAPVAPCEAAIRAAERAQAIPAGLLEAIGRVEAGRRDPGTGAATIWPWTTNVGGAGSFYASTADAETTVATLQAQGIDSVDVGCVQINLRHHPHAFATLHDAFDPATNVAYGARFLRQLRAQTGSWAAAVAAYHSMTPDLGQAYADRVLAIWNGTLPPGEARTRVAGAGAVVPAGPYGVWPPPGTAFGAIPPANFAYRAFAQPAASPAPAPSRRMGARAGAPRTAVASGEALR